MLNKIRYLYGKMFVFAVNQMYFHCRKLNGGEAVRKTTLTNRLFCTVFSVFNRLQAGGKWANRGRMAGRERIFYVGKIYVNRLFLSCVWTFISQNRHTFLPKRTQNKPE